MYDNSYRKSIIRESHHTTKQRRQTNIKPYKINENRYEAGEFNIMLIDSIELIHIFDSDPIFHI